MKKVETTTEGKALKLYTPPSLEVLGTVAELTGAEVTGNASDNSFTHKKTVVTS